jgi:hypothetical protein
MPTFASILESTPRSVAAVAWALRSIITSVAPRAIESIRGGAKVRMALYALDEKVFCGIGAAGEDCLLYVHRVRPGEFPRLPLEGKGRHALHVRFSGAGTLDGVVVRELIELAAIRALGAGP